MKEYTVNIEDIEELLKENPNLEIDTPDGWVRVIDYLPKGLKKGFRLILNNGLELKCTDNHRVQTLQGMKELQHLTKEDLILTKQGYSGIKTILELEELLEVCDINVQHTNHRFYAEDIAVHNCQDLDNLQQDFIELLVKGNESIKVVAVYDYLQTLYKFRYATPERLLAWGENKNKLFSITKKLPLIMNYRSDANIVKANNLLRRMGGQLESVPFKDTIGKTAIEFKTCYVNILEGNEIVNTIKDLVSNQGYKYSDIAVIIRTNKFLKEIVEPAIIKADIPYRTANTSTGAKLLDRELSNYLFNALSIYDDSEDAVALIAILSIIFSNENELYRDQIANLASKLQKSKKDLLESLEQFATADFISEKALRIYKEILEPSEERVLMVNILHHFSIILLDIINELKMDRAILRDGQLVINSIVNMVSQIAHDKKINTLPELIKLAIEVSETYNGDTTEDCISIGSIHSAKGMEYRVTISAGFTSGKTVQDTDNDLLEKFYVQTSRAIEKSILISSLSFQSFGDESKILDESGFTEASILSYFVDYKKHCRFSGIAINSGITIE